LDTIVLLESQLRADKKKNEERGKIEICFRLEQPGATAKEGPETNEGVRRILTGKRKRQLHERK